MSLTAGVLNDDLIPIPRLAVVSDTQPQWIGSADQSPSPPANTASVASVISVAVGP